MSLTSFGFIGFLLVCLAVYYLAPKKYQWLVLLAFSYGFYMAGGLKTLCYILFTTAVTYGAGLILGRLNSRRNQLSPQERKRLGQKIKLRKQAVVFLVCAVNFGLLFAMKYWNDVASLLDLPKLSLLMPLGLSFYIFQSVGYVIDCYRGKYPPERNFLKYALFVSFFPQLIQGPISRFDQLAPQLTAQRSFSADSVKYGIQLMMWGYFKKLIIADRAGVIVNTVFANHGQYGGAVIAFSVICYAIQLYGDFSGGIDITRGAAQTLGIDMIQNFQRPLFAQSLAEYWRRWHISLGNWMRDYVFYSLTLSKPFVNLGKFTRRRIGGKLGKVIPTSAATFVVYFIIGIWHGANLRYIFFGLWNGAIITASLLLAGPYHTMRTRLGIPEDAWWWKAFRTVRTWFLVFLGRYITRAPRLLTAFSMMWATVSRPCVSDLWNGMLLKLGLPLHDLLIIALGCMVMIGVEWHQEKGGNIRSELEKQSFWVQLLVLVVSVLALVFLGVLRGGYISAEFIYKQF